MAIWLPSLSALWGEDEAAWTAYLVLQQVCFALLSIAAWQVVPDSMKIVFLATTGWFLAQVVDEVVLGNHTENENWERLVFAIYVALVWALDTYGHIIAGWIERLLVWLLRLTQKLRRHDSKI